MTRRLAVCAVALTLPVFAPASDSANAAVAQGYERTEFADFLLNQRDWHGRKVEMHATFDAARARFTNSAHDVKFFKASGYSTDSHYMFAVTFKGQSKHWLYPGFKKKDASHAIWKQIQQFKEGDRITLYGKLKVMGDTGRHAYDPNRKSYGGGLSEVPSILAVERVARGWVKTLPEYIADLDGPDTLVRETQAMLLRAGTLAVKAMAKLLRNAERTERQRVHAAQVLGRSKSTAILPRLATVVRQQSNSTTVRGAALAAMQALRTRDALKELGKLASAKPPDEWAKDGMIALLCTGKVRSYQLRRAMGSRWRKMANGLAPVLRERAQAAWDADQPAEAAGLVTAALTLDPKHTASRLLRVRATLAAERIAVEPALADQVESDLKALRKAGQNCSAEWVALAGAVLDTGNADRAAAFVARVLKAEPENTAAAAFKVDMLVHRATAAWDAGDKAQAATLAQEALTIAPTHRPAKRVLFLAQDRPLEMLDAKRVGADGVTAAAPAGFTYLPRAMRPERLMVWIGEQIFARNLDRDPPHKAMTLLLLRKYTPRGVATSEQLATGSMGSIRHEIHEPERGVMTLDSGAKGAWAITTFRTRRGHLNRQFWGFLWGKERFAQFNVSSDTKFFDAHRELIFEMFRTFEFKAKTK